VGGLIVSLVLGIEISLKPFYSKFVFGGAFARLALVPSLSPIRE
jgi:hypothetical protein